MIPDIRYHGTTGPQFLDLYAPPESFGAARPTIVIIHGGGWRVGDKRDARETQMAEVLTAAGYVCASINYTMMVGEKPAWPMYLDDAREAVRFLRRNAATYRIDPTRIGAIGGSAGGNIALMLGLDVGGDVPANVKAVVALYPPTDMGWAGKSRAALFGCTEEQAPAISAAASPLLLATAVFPPTFLVHGTADAVVPLDHSLRMADRLKTLGVEHQLKVIDGAPHTHKLHDQHADVREEVIAFFDRHLAYVRV